MTINTEVVLYNLQSIFMFEIAFDLNNQCDQLGIKDEDTEVWRIKLLLSAHTANK